MGWLLLGETLTTLNIIGMIVTISGVILVVLERQTTDKNSSDKNKLKLSYPLVGVLFAFGGAAGQSAGLVLSKFGMKDYNAFSASQIRVFAGMIGFTILFTLRGKWKNVVAGFKDKKGLKYTSIGSVFGPFLGVAFSLLAVQNTTTGVASTIMSIVPVLIIPPAVIFLKEKVNLKEIIGAVMAVIGVSLLFLG